MDQLRQEVNELKTSVAVLCVRFETHCEGAETFQTDTKELLRGITRRLDEKVNGKFDEHAKMLTQHASDITTLATSMKADKERHTHTMNRAGDSPKAVTFTLAEDVLKKLTRTLIVLLATIMAAIAAAMIGVPVPMP